MAIRLCDRAINCPDPGDPLLGVSSLTINPAVPADTGVVFGDPDTGIVFGIPDENIALGYPIKYCPGIHCPGDDFLNTSTECDDVDYLADRFICQCITQSLDLFFRAPGVGPFTWTVDNLPDGLLYIVDYPCTGILRIFGAVTAPGRYLIPITVTDGFGNTTSATLQINIIQIITTSMPDVVIGTPYSFQLEAAGGSGLYGWSITAGGLAPGLQLHQDGLITGTPTGFPTGSITFHVVDLECEAAPPIQPFLTLTGAATTTTARIIGFPQFGSSTFPKAYKSISWSGNVRNVRRVAPAKTVTTVLVYCDTTTIDIFGNQTGIGRQENGWVADQRLPLVNTVVNGPCLFTTVDANDLITVSFNVLPAAFAFGPSASARDAVYGLVGEGGYNHVTSRTTASKQFVGTIGGVLVEVDKNVTLSDEYTDADAMAAATVLSSAGLVAISLPRTTGFLSIWTTVAYTIDCQNLMPGQPYVVTIDLFSSDGTTVTRTYNFTAAVSTYSITDNIPTPPDGMWTVARNPIIALAP